MEVRNILSNGETGQRCARDFITDVSRDSSDNVDASGFRQIQDRSATHAIDGNSVNEVGVSPLLASADVSREEAEGARSDSGESKPSNLSPDRQRDARWEEWYRVLWQFKVSTGRYKDHC